MAHFSQCYKAAAVMCRRALQLDLEAKLGLGENRLTLGPLLDMAVEKGGILAASKLALADRVKDWGDQVAHKVVDLRPETVPVVIHDTVDVLNHLYETE